MPKLVRKTSHVEARKPFGVYDGPEPEPGNYLGVVKSVALRTFDTGTQAINVLVELEAPADSPKAKYNGYPAWTKLFLGENEHQIARENAFYQAVSGRSDVDVVFDDKSDKKDSPITKIGGTSPVGKKVRVQIQLGDEYKGRRQLEGDSIFPALEGAPTATTVQGDPDAGSDPDEAAVEITGAGQPSTDKAAANPDHDGQQGQPPADDVDYHALALPALRTYAAGRGIDAKQPKKALLAALDALSEGGDEAGAPTKPKTAVEAEKLTAEQLLAFFKDEYEEGDLDGLGKDELIEEFTSAELITAF